MLKIAIHGAAGRMGCRLIALASDDPELELVAAVEHEQHPRLGDDSGLAAGQVANGIPLSGGLSEQTQVVVDFSLPAAVDGILARCLEREIPLVIATTGMTEATHQAIQRAAEAIPIVWAPNMSLAVNLTMKLTEITSQVLARVKADVDIEILERHHRHKADAPSGTALKFGEIIRQQMGAMEEVHGRKGEVGARPRNEIGYHAIRVSDDPGQHTILFGMPGEKIELNVGASSRDSYAAGALAAAKFVFGKPAGLYSMTDVLGI